MAAESTAATRKKPAAAKKKAPARKKPAAKKTATSKKAPGTRKSAVAKKAAGTKKAAGVKRRTAATRKKPAATTRAPVKSVPKAKGADDRVKRAEQPLMKALRAEHRHMASVMQLFADQLNAIDDGQIVDTHVVYEIMDYMVTWPDRYHHPREDLIYGRVAELDATAADEVDTLQRDHDNTARRGREVLKDIEHWREGDVTGAVVVKSGRSYIDHLYEHMNVEEKVVFPHIEAVLDLQDWRELAEDDQLKAASDPVFGPRVQREFRNMTRKMRRNVRRTVERGTMVEWIGIEALMESFEVLSMAHDSARGSTGDHVRAALEDSKDIFRESPMSALFKTAANNVKLTMRLLEELAGISRDTLDDLSRVNQERKDRLRLLEREPAR